MLRSANAIRGYVLRAEDGEIGRCKDFLFDERHWTIRYMVADTGKWLPGRRVIISPIALGEPEWEGRRFPVRLAREQIERAPSLDEDAPVSRQHESEHFLHYGWPRYWEGVGIWGWGPYPMPLYFSRDRGPASEPSAQHGADPHLRSTREVTGYRIHAMDGEMGHVEDFIVDDVTWTIRYVVVNTGRLLSGRKVLLAPSWIASVDWADREVVAILKRDEIRRSPAYDPSAPVNRQYEKRLYDLYGRPRYWEHSPEGDT